MKAALVEELGQAPRYTDVAEPEPTGNQVVGEVRAAAVKNIERLLAAGTHYGSGQLQLPGMIGVDAVVVLPDGRRVYTGTAPPGGALAERMPVDPAFVVELPDAVDDAAAAALPNPAVSAWLGLEYAGQLRPGQSVLVLGGTGVTGSLAVQLAKHQFGAGRVVAVGRNPDRLEQLAGWGADATLHVGDDPEMAQLRTDLARMHAEVPFDLVLDYLWGKPAEQTLHALANDDLAAEFHRTRYIQIGEMAKKPSRCQLVCSAAPASNCSGRAAAASPTRHSPRSCQKSCPRCSPCWPREPSPSTPTFTLWPR